MTLLAANKRINAMNYRPASQSLLVSTRIVIILDCGTAKITQASLCPVSHVYHNINGKNIVNVFHGICKLGRANLYFDKITGELFDDFNCKCSYLGNNNCGEN